MWVQMHSGNAWRELGLTRLKFVFLLIQWRYFLHGWVRKTKRELKIGIIFHLPYNYFYLINSTLTKAPKVNRTLDKNLCNCVCFFLNELSLCHYYGKLLSVACSTNPCARHHPSSRAQSKGSLQMLETNALALGPTYGLEQNKPWRRTKPSPHSHMALPQLR